MKHLNEQELIDALDAPAPAVSTAAHLRDCAACGARLADLQFMLEDVRRSDVPVPSPLFYDGFARRVSAAIDASPEPVRAAWWPRLAWAGAAAALVLAVTVVMVPRQAGVAPAGGEPVVVTGDLVDLGAPSTGDEAWAVVASLADEAAYDDVTAAGVSPRAGSIESAAAALNEAERTELARLIEEAMKRTGP